MRDFINCTLAGIFKQEQGKFLQSRILYITKFDFIIRKNLYVFT